MLRNAVLTPTNRPFREPVPRGSYAGLDFDFRRRRFRVGGRLVAYDQAISLAAPSPKYVWNADAELFDSPAGQPAWDHDPFTGESRGQLIEAVEDVNHYPKTGSTEYGFVNQGVAITPNAAAAPDGSMTMDQVEQTETGQPYARMYWSAPTATDGQEVWLSLIIKAVPGSTDIIWGQFSGGGVEGWAHSLGNAFQFNPLTKDFQQAGNEAHLTELSNGFFQLEIRITQGTASGKYLQIQIKGESGGAHGVGTGGVYVWGWEWKTSRSSFIATNGSAVIRAGDAMNANTSFAEQYDPAQGWLFIDYEMLTNDAIVFIANPSGTAGNPNSFFIYRDRVYVYGETSAIINEPAIGNDGLGRHKVIYVWRNGEIAIFVDGIEKVRQIAAMPDVGWLSFFARNNGAGNANGHLFHFKMGDTISDAEAIARTRL